MPQSSFQPRILGRSGLRVSALGIAASYGVPAAAVEEAFDRGVNYLYWGSLRRGAFAQALRNLRSRRDEMALALQSFSRLGGMLERGVERGLREIGYERADVLLLGYWQGPVWPRVRDAALRLRERGLVRHIGMSSHHRPLVPQLAGDNIWDVFHLRYSAVHRGAERDVFPQLPAANAPGIVAYTATSWGRLLHARRMPAGVKTPSGADCYRFALSHPSVDVCMTGPANLLQMRESLRALELGPMCEEELAWMRRAGDAIRGATSA
ncbi:MAG: aldo/keto reductase [Candidatus Solibacter usitatus]|nr:aldo/keto reductase [Candidatus Solibacter usitatus]